MFWFFVVIIISVSFQFSGVCCVFALNRALRALKHKISQHVINKQHTQQQGIKKGGKEIKKYISASDNHWYTQEIKEN